MNEKITYDLIGIGIGPFNLGMAALCQPVSSLNCLFFDQSSEFDWHPGMMIANTTLQVPFLADLVLPVDPTSPYTFVNYLKEIQQLFKFCIKEENFLTRKEYNNYCKWVAAQLTSCHFGYKVKTVNYHPERSCYEVQVIRLADKSEKIFFTKRLVLGMGTKPYVPEFAKGLLSEKVFHNSNYLYNRQYVLNLPSVTVVGSGQSAGEVFYDLLQQTDSARNKLNWFTRAQRFYPMEYARLTHEFTSPDYINYFYDLPAHKKDAVLAGQDMLYKGMNVGLINAIYDLLFYKNMGKEGPNAVLTTNCELQDVLKKEDDTLSLTFYHLEQEKYFTYTTNALILATGYKAEVPALLQNIHDRIQWDERKRFAVNRNYSIDKMQGEIFVLNAELHTHGFLAPDLGMGPYRNAHIINEVLGYEHYRLEEKIAFQTFGIPEDAEETGKSPKSVVDKFILN